MAPGSRDNTNTPSNGTDPSKSNANNIGGSGSKNVASPYLPSKARWFNTNILGQAVEAVQEDVAEEEELQMAEDAFEAQDEMEPDDYDLPLAFR